MNPPTVGGKFAAKDVGGGVPDAPGGVKTPPYDAKDKGAAMARLRAGHARPLRRLPFPVQSSFFNRYPILYTVSILSIQPSFLRRRAMWVSTVRRLSVSGMPPQTRSYITSR